MDGEGIGALIGLIVGAIIVFYLVVYVVLPAVAIVTACGSLWGGGHALVNYCKAMRAKVAFEKFGTP